jgi:hypothetical protein
MSAFTLEKPRPLGTRKRGFGSTNFNGQIVLMDYLIEKRLAANLFPDFQYENTGKGWPQC